MSEATKKTIEIMEGLKDYSINDVEKIISYMRIAFRIRKKRLQTEFEETQFGDVDWEEVATDLNHD